MSDDNGERGPFTPRNGFIAAAVIAFAVGAYFILSSDKKTVKSKPTAQQIQLVRPNTPPPPPPKPPEKPPEPPKIKEEVKVEQPKVEQPKAEAPPPAERLGVDAQGSGPGDGFGLAANPGGRDITQSANAGGGVIGGTGTGVTRTQYAFYRDTVTRHVTDELNRVNDLKDGSGQVAILVWVDRTGRIERVELRDANSRQTDLIRATLLNGKPLREPPPEAMPQPVWILMNLREIG